MPRRKKKKQSVFNKKNLLGVFIISIMVLSGIGYMWSDDDSQNNYNGQRFVLAGNYWVTKIDGKDTVFSYHPADLENIEVGSSIDTILQSKMVYITFDPNSELVSDIEVARMQLELELYKKNIFPVAAITQNSVEYQGFPIVTCANASINIPVIMFSEANETAIDVSGSCINAKAVDGYDVTPLKERLIYGLYGII